MPLLSHLSGETFMSAGSTWDFDQVQIGYKNTGQELHALVYSQGKQSQIGLTNTLNTVELAYRILGNKFFYLEAPKKLLLHIFIKTNRQIFRLKKKYPELEVGLGILCISSKEWWTAVVGDFSVYKYKAKTLGRVELEETMPELGKSLLGTYEDVNLFRTTGAKFETGEILVLMTKTLTKTVNEKKITELLSLYKQGQTKITEVTEILVEEAKKRRKQDYYGVVLVEKIDNQPKITFISSGSI